MTCFSLHALFLIYPEEVDDGPHSNRSSGNQEYLAALDRFKDTLPESPLEGETSRDHLYEARRDV